MSIEVPTGTTLTFDRFWRWLMDHSNCILRVGTPEASLVDQEDFHWHFEEEGPGQHWVQLIRGKQLVGELFFDAQGAQYVQCVPDRDAQDRGWFVFEVIAETPEGSFPSFHFLMNHGMEQETAHPAGLKH